MNFLDRIISDKKNSLEELKKHLPIARLKESGFFNMPTRDFKKALTSSEINIIAEIKKASPSKGIIVNDFNLESIAMKYESSSCSAISVLTEEKYFKGSLDYLQKVKKITSKPVLRKDFIFDEYQIYESKAFGADALLLISTSLDEETLKRLIFLTLDLNMVPLVEVHNELDLDKAINSNANVIGINNRDLKTFKVDLQTSASLSDKIPSNIIIVSESGINSSGDIKELKKSGISAFLIGEGILKSNNAIDFINQLTKGDR